MCKCGHSEIEHDRELFCMTPGCDCNLTRIQVILIAYAALIEAANKIAINTAAFIQAGRGLWAEHSRAERTQAAAGALAVADALKAALLPDAARKG